MAPAVSFLALLGGILGIQNAVALIPKMQSGLSTFNKRDIVAELGPRLSDGAAIYLPSSPNWANESSRWSVYNAPTWNYVVVPETEKDIATTIKYATANNISFMAQGGGHGYSGTLNIIQNAIMIRMEKFAYANVDKKSQTVKVGGGTTFGTLISALHPAGQVLPVGVSPCVGATGATLGGGHGRLQGFYGLMLDSVKSYRVVLADGSIVTASRKKNADLFYAMQGAGQNFGVVTETLFQTYDDPAPDGLYYNVDMSFTGDKLESVLATINEIIPSQPPELALIFLMVHSDPTPLLLVNLVWSGARKTGLKYSKLFNATSPETFIESMVSYADLPAKSNGGSFTGACAKGNIHKNYSANMKYFNLTTMRTAYNTYADFMKNNPGTEGTSWLIEIFNQDGENRTPSDRDAYSNRGFDNITPIIDGEYMPGDTKAEAAAEVYLSTVRDLIAETSGYGKLYIYQNYAHGDEDLGSIYGYDKKRFLKLQCLKLKYDPGNVFNGYHDIPLPKRGECRGQ